MITFKTINNHDYAKQLLEQMHLQAKDGITVEKWNGFKDAFNEEHISKPILVAGKKVKVERPENFRTRGAVGKWVYDSLLDAGASPDYIETILSKKGLWIYLTVQLFGDICQENDGTIVAAKERSRYYPTTGSSDFYRHLVRFPVWVIHNYGEDTGWFFLYQRPYIMPDLVEQVASRPYMIYSKGVIDAISELYQDQPHKSWKQGVTETSKESKGTLRALAAVLAQISCNYDVASMDKNQIIQMLPPEFDSYRYGV